MTSLLTFTARTIAGSGRGKSLGTPTINLDLNDVPKDLPHGIYACRVIHQYTSILMYAVMHYGPRPVFGDSVACEVHILDEVFSSMPATLTVTVVKHIRDVENFADAEALKEKISEDITKARDILQ